MLKTKLIFFTYDSLEVGGREVLSRNLRDAIVATGCFEVVDFVVNPRTRSLLFCISLFFGFPSSLKIRDVVKFVFFLKKQGPCLVFVNGSNYGIISFVSSRILRSKTFTFFHNNESNFFNEMAECSASLIYKLKSRLIAFSMFISESLVKKSLSRLIFLNERDRLSVLGKCSLKRSTICPLFIRNPSKSFESFVCSDMEDYRLVVGFLGSAFFSNVEAVKFIFRSVAPFLPDCKFIIAGRGFYKADFPTLTNVDVIGAIDSLDVFYSSIDCVVSPIFSGSGMKTKTAEAFAFGCRVVGSFEAFVGYESYLKVFPEDLCVNNADFIDRLSCFTKDNTNSDTIKQLFLSEYSFDAGVRNLEQILYSSVRL